MHFARADFPPVALLNTVALVCIALLVVTTRHHWHRCGSTSLPVYPLLPPTISSSFAILLPLNDGFPEVFFIGECDDRSYVSLGFFEYGCDSQKELESCASLRKRESVGRSESLGGEGSVVHR